MKRARTSVAPSAPDTSMPAAARPFAVSIKTDKKKGKVQVKKLKKECRYDAVKFRGSHKSIEIDNAFRGRV
ncbi:hypothetical protein BYT27DRAFT_7247465 [Phlegmacium glaucopus]|nr:hypothetical protein BYT27DRAFT_7247465 [Phlegmacium glaucopus]